MTSSKIEKLQLTLQLFLFAAIHDTYCNIQNKINYIYIIEKN
jgi:hypothetical protein